mmetsp:Transcript_7469/g.16053  ORF Transcript_7469/g.16053 Transcript_7469/m.16053 type:complete len:259 (-) Transcript_7469:1311-2087(-)
MLAECLGAVDSRGYARVLAEPDWGIERCGTPPLLPVPVLPGGSRLVYPAHRGSGPLSPRPGALEAHEHQGRRRLTAARGADGGDVPAQRLLRLGQAPAAHRGSCEFRRCGARRFPDPPPIRAAAGEDPHRGRLRRQGCGKPGHPSPIGRAGAGRRPQIVQAARSGYTAPGDQHHLLALQPEPHPCGSPPGHWGYDYAASGLHLVLLRHDQGAGVGPRGLRMADPDASAGRRRLPSVGPRFGGSTAAGLPPGRGSVGVL